MPNKDPGFHEAPAKPGGEGWLFNKQQERLVHFKPAMATAHAQWVEVRTFSWIPPRPPVPEAERRMLRHNTIEA